MFRRAPLLLCIAYFISCVGNKSRTETDEHGEAVQTAEPAVVTEFPDTALPVPGAASDTLRIGREGAHPPQTYVDRGACPYECCVYREWVARGLIPVHPAEGDTVTVAYHLAPGERFRAHTGNVHLEPTGIAVFQRDVIYSTGPGPVRRFQGGDTLYILSPLGEGYYNLWYRGEVVQYSGCWEEGSAASAAPTDCKLVRSPVMRWWVQIESAPGDTGWVDMQTHGARVGLRDACSVD